MKIEPEGFASLAEQYKLVKKESSESLSKVQGLVTQVRASSQVRKTPNKLLCMARNLCACLRRKATKIYDFNPPTAAVLISPQTEGKQGMKTLVLDLDETLVHSTFEPTEEFDFVVKVNVEGNWYNVYVKQRPGLETFLEEAAQLYELVVYTASLANYADPVLDHIDPKKRISHRLFREHCVLYNSNFVKDLGRLGRELSNVVILDVYSTQNSPASYLFHPDHAVPIRSYFDDPTDRELEEVLGVLREMTKAEDVATFLTPYRRGLSERATMELSLLADRLECNSPRVP